MLPAQARLRSPEDFRATVRGGVRAGRTTVVVHARHTADAHATGESAPLPPRVGFVVSKAVGNAVTRNRVKRQLRHLMAPELADLPRDTMVVVRALPPSAGSGQLGADLRSAVSAVRRKLEA